MPSARIKKKERKRSTLDLLVVSSKKNKTIPSCTRPSLGVRPCCLLCGLHFPASSCFAFRILPPLGVKEQRQRRPMPSIVSAAWKPYLIEKKKTTHERCNCTPPHCRQWSNQMLLSCGALLAVHDGLKFAVRASARFMRSAVFLCIA